MSNRLLDFSQYLSGADNVKVINLFPRSQKSFTYDFTTDVSTWDFTADYQSLVVDQIAFDRQTGDPNFADSTIIGYIDNKANVDVSMINDSFATSGLITFTIPQNRYTGGLMPNGRKNQVITVVSFQWQTDDTPAQYDMHRWAVIETWEPGVDPTDPILSTSYIPIGVGGIATFTDNASTDADRVAGTYAVGGISSAGSDGSGAVFEVVVSDAGATDVKITTRGTNYVPGDTIQILDSSLGGGGAADITVTVASIA